jgi:hypothetical protein
MVDERKLPEIWACTGNKQRVLENLEGSWNVLVLLSYPVNGRHLALNAAGTDLCHTFKIMFNILDKHLTAEQREKTLITDVFPYVGHPSALGRQNTSNPDHKRAMIGQASRILTLKPKIILASGAAACWALHQTRTFKSHSVTAVLGIPSFLINDTLVILQPHYSLKTYGYVFENRGKWLAHLLKGKLYEEETEVTAPTKKTKPTDSAPKVPWPPAAIPQTQPGAAPEPQTVQEGSDEDDNDNWLHQGQPRAEYGSLQEGPKCGFITKRGSPCVITLAKCPYRKNGTHY